MRWSFRRLFPGGSFAFTIPYIALRNESSVCTLGLLNIHNCDDAFLVILDDPVS
jgi:hypothetical protein